jgi:hypothetical protein
VQWELPGAVARTDRSHAARFPSRAGAETGILSGDRGLGSSNRPFPRRRPRSNGSAREPSRPHLTGSRETAVEPYRLYPPRRVSTSVGPRVDGSERGGSRRRSWVARRAEAPRCSAAVVRMLEAPPVMLRTSLFPPRFPFHPDPLEGLGRRQRPAAGDRAEACLGYGPTRRDPPDGARMTPADRTGAIRESAAGGRRRLPALPRPLGSLAPLRARIKVPILYPLLSSHPARQSYRDWRL